MRPQDQSVLAVSRAAILQGCHVGVIALSDPADRLLYKDPIVDYDLRYDLDTPSVSILEAVHFLHKASYTHVIIQQVGATPARNSCLSVCSTGCPQQRGRILAFLSVLVGLETPVAGPLNAE